jgi:thiamine monophosphate synthase
MISNKSLYYFTNSLSKINKENILKFKNINVVYNNENYSINFDQLTDIKKFCLKNYIKIFIVDNFNIAKRFNLDGIILSNYKQKNLSLNINKFNKKNFEVISKVHSQKEYFFMKKKNCNKFMLSPIFQTQKYNFKGQLGVTRFNLMTLNWNCKIYALGGINLTNSKKIKMTKCLGYGFTKLFEFPK